MGDDIFDDGYGKVFGSKTPFSFLQEVVIQNKGITIDVVEKEANPLLKIKSFISTITVSHSQYSNIVVTGPPAPGKQQARHEAACEVFRRLRLNKCWLLSAQTPIAGKKWQIPESSFLTFVNPVVAGNTRDSDCSVSANFPKIPTKCPVTPTVTTPRSTPAQASNLTPSSGVSMDWITKLIAYCMRQKKYAPPTTSDVGGLEGSSNVPIFTAECQVVEQASGKIFVARVKAQCKKQIVRQLCAQKVLMMLMERDGLTWNDVPIPEFIMEVDEIVRHRPNAMSEQTIQAVSASSPEQLRVVPQSMDAVLPMEIYEEEDTSTSSSSVDIEPISKYSSFSDDSSDTDGDLKYDCSFRDGITEITCPELPILIKCKDEDEIALDFDFVSFNVGNIVCKKSFEECVKLGYDHFGHAVIRDLAMNDATLVEFMVYEYISGKRAIELLDDLVRQQIFSRERSDYLQVLRGLNARKTNHDNTVHVAYKRMNDGGDYNPGDKESCMNFPRMGGKSMCVSLKFHHQSIDFRKLGFGNDFEEAKEEAAVEMVKFLGKLCTEYR